MTRLNCDKKVKFLYYCGSDNGNNLRYYFYYLLYSTRIALHLYFCIVVIIIIILQCSIFVVMFIWHGWHIEHGIMIMSCLSFGFSFQNRKK